MNGQSSKPSPNIFSIEGEPSEPNIASGVRDTESVQMGERNLPKIIRYFASALMLITAAYHMFAAGFWGLPGIQHVAVHLGFGIAIIYLLYPASNKIGKSKIFLGIDVGIAIFSLVNMVYVAQSYATLANRVGLPSTTIELIMGGITFIMLFEAARRTMGIAFPIVVLFFVAFMFFGAQLPAPWTHGGATYMRFIQLFYMQMSGIYGSITRVSADVVLIFVLFASIIKYSQIGDFIMDIALGLVGGVRGGPAKVAAISSGLMGMVSGNSVANVAGTGSITIPLMKKTGYKASFAGAVEAVASSGGQIMPPVMGTSVFIMMELANTSYQTIMLIALPIAILYYAGLMISVDLTAVSLGLRGISAAERPDVKKTIKEGWYLVLPILILTGLMIIGKTPQYAGFWGIISAVVISFLCPRDRMTIPRLIEATKGGIKDCCMMFAVCSLASLIQGIVQVSGIGVKLSSILINLSGGNLLILLLATAGVCIILGMGMPVVVCYSFLAMLVAPAIVELGVPLLIAHMFVFYYGCMSCITPPVATAALVAAGIARAPFLETALQACKLAFSIFFIPFYFVYSPEFLFMDGVSLETILSVITVAIAVYSAASGFSGVAFPSIKFEKKYMLRAVLIFAAIVILVPIPYTNYIGAVITIAIQLLLMANQKKYSTELTDLPKIAKEPFLSEEDYQEDYKGI